MLNRWDEEEARGLDDLGLLVYQSRLLGAEPSLVLHGGGNTSIKTVETDFRGRPTHVLRVKGSGSDMKTIERKHFAGVRMEDILPLQARETMSDEEMVAYLAQTLMEPNSPRPSIETLLHGFVPFKSVAHTHADAIVALTNNSRGRDCVRECFGERVLIEDYVRPGFGLSRSVGAAAAQSPDVRAMVLMHHGFITWGETAREAYDLHIALVTEAEEYAAAHKAGKRVFGQMRVAPLPEERRRWVAAALGVVIRGAATRAASPPPDPASPGLGWKRQVVRFCDQPHVLDFVGSEHARALSQVGPATPDHLLHTRRLPLFLDLKDLENTPECARAIQDQMQAWSAAYAEYFKRNSRSGEQMLEACPRVVLLPGVGMWTLGKDARAARVPEDIYQHTIEVIGSAAALGEYRSIPEPDAFDVEYWPLELYKLSLAPPEKDLARRVALITGATGAIGRAIAERFAREGAHVVVTDLDAERCAEAAAELCRRYGAGIAVGIPMDVTNEHSVSEAFQQAALAYGGLDILVSNAGIAHSARIQELSLADWQRSLDVNATGHFLAARAALRIFAAQAIGGCIVFNVTKNTLAAGAEFGAYSAAKAAELQLARVVAIEAGSMAVRVNMLNPDAIFSAGLWSDEMKARRAAAQGIEVSEVEEFYRKRNLLKARVTAEDVAEAALWLASDRSAKTTGCIIPVDGGVREAFPR